MNIQKQLNHISTSVETRIILVHFSRPPNFPSVGHLFQIKLNAREKLTENESVSVAS
jgi:hypothetical protein